MDNLLIFIYLFGIFIPTSSISNIFLLRFIYACLQSYPAYLPNTLLMAMPSEKTAIVIRLLKTSTTKADRYGTITASTFPDPLLLHLMYTWAAVTVVQMG